MCVIFVIEIKKTAMCRCSNVPILCIVGKTYGCLSPVLHRLLIKNVMFFYLLAK